MESKHQGSTVPSPCRLQHLNGYAFEPNEPLLQSFTAETVRLAFRKPGDVSGTHTISGSLGTTEFKLTLGNEVEISGTLKGPRLTVFEEVSGTGKWFQSTSYCIHLPLDD